MKKFIAIIALIVTSNVASAQYVSNYYNYSVNPYSVAAAIETKQLNNIRFNGSELYSNPTAYRQYVSYLEREYNYVEKRNKWGLVAISGLGVAATASIPGLISLYLPYDDPKSNAYEISALVLFQ